MLETYVIYVSNECNCQCTYCYLQNRDDTKEYTWEETKEYLDNIIKYNKKFVIEFLGGEPMLNFPLIKQSIEYLESIKEIMIPSYIITTNGTIIHDELIQLMKTYPQLKWMASMDGTPWMNQLRITKDNKNTYNIVIQNFKRLKEELDDVRQLGIHIVTHPYNVLYLSRGVEHLYQIGFRFIGIGTVESTINIGKEYSRLYIRELEKVSKSITQGKYPGLYVDILEGLKPASDIRYYLYDKDDKIIGESYGREPNDITTKDTYKTRKVTSKTQNLIQGLREIVYTKHQERMRKSN